MKFVLSAGLALASWVALADTVVSEDFADGTLSGTWSGGLITTATTAGTVSVGSAITATATTPAAKKITTSEAVYGVSGTATCATSSSSTTTYEQADFLMFVEEAADEPDADDTSLDTDVQIAVAAGPQRSGAADGTSEIYVYCTANSTKGWYATGFDVTTGAWYRVTLNFDYSAGKCQVCLNGIAANSTYGTTTASGDTTGGSWYKFANATPESAKVDIIATVAFVGSTQIDDVVISTTTTPATYQYVGSVETTDSGTSASAVAIPYTWLAKYSLTPSDVKTTTDSTGMTVADKYATGLEPGDGIKFQAAAMTPVTESGKGSITVPCAADNGQAYYVKFKDASGTVIDYHVVVNKTHADYDTDALHYTVNGDGTATIPFVWPTLGTAHISVTEIPNVLQIEVDAFYLGSDTATTE